MGSPTARWDMRLRAGRKVLWDALVWQRRPGNRKRKVHKSQARISFISNPSASALMMLQAKNKAAYAAPVPVEGPVALRTEISPLSHLPVPSGMPKEWDCPMGRPTDVGLVSDGGQPHLKPRVARGSTGRAHTQRSCRKGNCPI